LQQVHQIPDHDGRATRLQVVGVADSVDSDHEPKPPSHPDWTPAVWFVAGHLVKQA
jgi:hypothetical protein